MELLVSVVNEEQAAPAATLGVVWVDLKDPSRGPLGMASQVRQQAVLERLRAWPNIRRSVALGEVAEHDSTQPLPLPCPGFQFAKLGTAHLIPAEPTVPPDAAAWWPRWSTWYHALPDGCQGVLVAYADSRACLGMDVDTALDLALRHNLPYVLVDTYDKAAGGLFPIVAREYRLPKIRTWIDRAKQQGTHLALAGQLSLSEVQQLSDWQAEIVGVRSAVCERDELGVPIRSGALCPDRLQRLLAACQDSTRGTAKIRS